MAVEHNTDPQDDEFYFDLAKMLMASRTGSNTATLIAIEEARKAAIRAVIETNCQRVQELESVGLGMATRIAADAAMTAIMKYVEAFNLAAPVCTDMDFELVAILDTLRETRAA